MSTAYSLIFRNQSSQSGTACIYQTPPASNNPGGMPLAWLTRFAPAGGLVTFQWEIDYSFVWSQLENLEPGAVFVPSQSMAADPSSLNRVTFSEAGGFPTFQEPGRGGQPGTLEILQDSSIRPYSASIGIGMGGSAVFAVPAQPNFIAAFTPHPEYWITFGDYSPGQVLDPSQIGTPVQVTFPPGVTSMTAILSANGTLSIHPT